MAVDVKPAGAAEDEHDLHGIEDSYAPPTDRKLNVNGRWGKWGSVSSDKTDRAFLRRPALHGNCFPFQPSLPILLPCVWEVLAMSRTSGMHSDMQGVQILSTCI